jgi:hypothetical protein
LYRGIASCSTQFCNISKKSLLSDGNKGFVFLNLRFWLQESGSSLIDAIEQLLWQ